MWYDEYMVKNIRHIPMPTNKVVYIGFSVLVIPTIFWVAHFLNFFGVSFFLRALVSLPYCVLLGITVICPIVSFIFGSIAYLAHPEEKRKLTYQALIVVSIFYILTLIVHLMDGGIG